MNILKNKLGISMMAFLAIITFTLPSCKNVNHNTQADISTPAEILSSVTWKTTRVKNQKGEDVTAANNGFVGLADFHKNGQFEIRGFDNKVRSSGIWALTADGKKRILVTDQWTRVVDVIVLNKDLFTYKITNNDGVTVNVEHVPVK
jgi:hypothetical protein